MGIGKEISVFEKLSQLTKKKVEEYKIASEANIVSIIYKNPEFLTDIDITIKDFSINYWKVYFEIARCLYIEEGKKTLDETTVGLYLLKHPKLNAVFDEFGGYRVIEESSKYVKIENFDGYLNELKKWNVVLSMIDSGIMVYDKLSDYVDMSLEDIYNEQEAMLNHIFSNIGNAEYTSHDIGDGIYELIDDLDEGIANGLPYHNLPKLTEETGGQILGSVNLIGGLSNIGKSTFVRNAVLPSIIKYDERIVIMLNEEDLSKWQRELLVNIANNILKKSLRKKTVRKGNFAVNDKSVLKEAADWLVENTKNKNITIITFKTFKTSRAIKVIRKYAALGVKYFILDTFKVDSGKTSEQPWISMGENMVSIYDTVKKENKNVNISITFQLAKSSSRQRYYTMDNIGVAKNIVDPASTCLMIRKIFDDEFPGESHELDITDINGSKVFLDNTKNYQLVFIVKNREGAAQTYQIVIEHDLSRNILREVGVCNNIKLDF